MVATENESAVTNLLAAYEAEWNAHARSKAYAVRAEAEGLERPPGKSRSMPATMRALFAKWEEKQQPIFALFA